ncbi:leucyl aminopeptidase family protein [Thiotrichales bacterium 19S3-7]|nr:leucyl aminopeptidase family protein [Thiotrichales bacterium 19S3-7]MCF6802916.1 leucyl aminopeptidase family protein [Thiotrichales bacterium 19S3-11]
MLKTIFQFPKISALNVEFNPSEHQNAYLIITIVDQLNQAAIDSFSLTKNLNNRFNEHYHKGDQSWVTQLPNDNGTFLIMIEKNKPFELMDSLKNNLNCLKPMQGNIVVVNLSQCKISEANTLRTVLAHTTQMPNFKKNKINKFINTINIYSNHNNNYLKEVEAGHYGNALARVLAATPTNFLKPSNYQLIIQELINRYKWDSTFYSYHQLKKMGANSFCAVARACPEEAFIVHLKYRHPKAKKLVSLVGKGICFDTGGVSLKQSQYMYNMHEDMQGSSVALGSLVALTEAKAEINVDCFLAVTLNLIDKEAYLLNEVITALNGTTIEVTDTDAEGRMALADTLHLASQENPDLLIDYATLTGAAVRAISTRYMALFTQSMDQLPNLIETGIISGERAWPFPIPKDFNQMIKSEVADVLQCSTSPSADHILAACFLNRFIDHEKVKMWIHLDLAASMNKGGLGSVPSDYTGIGVFYTQALLKSLI